MLRWEMGIDTAQPMFRGLMLAVALFLSTGSAYAQQRSGTDEAKEQGRKLGEKLIRSVGGGEEDLMEGIMRRMKESEQRIGLEFDAGESTQRLQETITNKLDEAIKIAASQRRQASQSPRPQRSDKRRAEQQRKKSQAGKARKASDSDSISTSDVGSSPDGKSPTAQSLKEARRAWGNLPQREREELIQGAGEQSIDRFRDWIERYYRALQESRDTKER